MLWPREKWRKLEKWEREARWKRLERGAWRYANASVEDKVLRSGEYCLKHRLCTRRVGQEGCCAEAAVVGYRRRGEEGREATGWLYLCEACVCEKRELLWPEFEVTWLQEKER